MSVKLTQQLIENLLSRGVSTHFRPGVILPDDVVFEPPCSFKWMSIQHSLRLGAFSYAVSGHYFGCCIGRYCSIGEQVQIGRHSHPMHYFSTSPIFYLKYKDVLDQELPEGIELDARVDFNKTTPPVVAKKTIIGNDVWIGHGAFILPGVRIGDGAVIAAMSVVTKDVPSYAIVAGSPARIKKYKVADTHIESLIQSRWWDFPPWVLKGTSVDNIPAFLDHISELRGAGVALHEPGTVKLIDLS
jgi:acetyltransferase-like isoleucine patch superfamily enzyme